MMHPPHAYPGAFRPVLGPRFEIGVQEYMIIDPEMAYGTGTDGKNFLPGVGDIVSINPGVGDLFEVIPADTDPEHVRNNFVGRRKIKIN